MTKYIFMLIGIDASRSDREFKGGTEWYSYYLIRELAKIDSTNQYVLYSDKPLTGGMADLTSEPGLTGEDDVKQSKVEMMKNGFQKIKSPHSNFKAKILNWPFTYFWTQVRLSWEMFFHPPEVLFIPAHALPIIHPKKSVVTIHDIGFERLEDVYSLDKIGPSHGLTGKIFGFLAKLFTGGKFGVSILDYHGWSTKFALRRAKKIIAVSKFTKQELMDVCGAPASKIEVVYNGFNPALYKPIADQRKIGRVIDKYGIKSPYIFYVGRLEKKKNITGLVEAFVIMREKYKNINHKLVLVGKAGLGFGEIKYIIEEFDFDSEVIITGWVPEKDLPYIYNGAALFVFPSLYEGFGIPLLEAMASGVPIAASRIPAISEITAGAAWLFDPKDKREMAEKIFQVLSDDKLAENLVSRGKTRIENFSLNKCAKETLAVIEGI